MTILVLAEKPSVARDLARVLGAGRRGEGYLEGGGYRVTWALGHLVHFAEPDDYGGAWAARWSLAQLPMIPESWQLRTAERTASQLRIIEKLLNAPETASIICATDAGREGEHIFRLIYEHARCRKPVQRLWVSSLTDEAIREGLARLQPGSAFDPLARAARARAQADWLVGMNLTRGYTVHNRVLCTIGRVQTPTLAMIVARDQAIAGFVTAYFYELVATLAEGFRARYCRDGETRLDTRAEAERLYRELAPHETGRVARLERKVRHNRPPPLYDLTSLQRDANRRFGLTAAQVLEQAQALYETHKLISYPRTESRHLPEDLVPRLPAILRGLEHPLAGEALARLEAGHRLGKAYVDDTRLTDHHAILPTGKRPPAGLPESARRIFDLVATRFVAVFLPDETVEETRVILDIGGAEFLARGSRVLDPGWKRAEPPRRRPASGQGVTGPAGAPAKGQALRPATGQPAAQRAWQAAGHVTGQSDGKSAGRADGKADEGADGKAASRTAGQTLGVEVGEALHQQAAGDGKMTVKNGQPPSPSGPEESADGEGPLPPLAVGQIVQVSGLEVVEKETQPPRPYDDASLLAAMKNAGREIEDDALAAAMKESGLGTPATRAEIIEKLIRTGYVERQRKQLRATAKGQALIGRVAEPLRSPELTAQWEQRLKDIERGQAAAEDFYRDIVAWVRGLIPTLGQGPALSGLAAVAERPPTGQGARQRPKRRDSEPAVQQAGQMAPRQGGRQAGQSARRKAGEKASRHESQTAVPKVGQKRGQQASRLESQTATPKVSQKEGQQASRIESQQVIQRTLHQAGQQPGRQPGQQAAVNPGGRQAADRTGGLGPLTCPKCGRGQIIAGRRGYGCERYREGCDFVVWKEVAGRELTAAQIRDLIATGRTGLIRGFTAASGVQLAARLRLDDQWRVVLDFAAEEALPAAGAGR